VSGAETRGRVFLTFGAVDFSGTLWINGEYAGSHRGGYTPFRIEISALVTPGDNDVLLRVTDTRDPGQPRGKQSWQAPFSCWYRGSSGIWQSVWLEFAPPVGIDRVRATATVTAISGPDRGDGHLEVVVRLSDAATGNLAVNVTGPNMPDRSVHAPANYPVTAFHLDVTDIPLWSPDSPELCDVTVTFTPESEDPAVAAPSGDNGDADAGGSASAGLRGHTREVDRVHTYVGFRQISVCNGMLHINGRSVYQRLILDQGYWPDGDYTAADDDAIRRDIELAMEMGFNGCRKHAKIEDPRFYYWADRLGFLVWEELPSAYRFTAQSRQDLLTHTLEMISRDAAHPAVIAWTLFNESWGVPDVHTDVEQQEFVRHLVETVRELDPHRLVVGNDGWEQVGGDVLGLHSYAPTAERLAADMDVAFGAVGDGGGGSTDATGVPDPQPLLENGRPFRSRHDTPAGALKMVTEFGGTGYRAPGDRRPNAWGYDNLAATPDELQTRLNKLVDVVRSRPDVAGFALTQLTDVEQEVNGLLFPDRTPKLDISAIREIIIGKT
jgi:hypothetical protein